MPECLYENPQGAKLCFRCGSKLLLSDRYRPTKRIGKGAFGRTFLAVDEQRLNTPCVVKQFLVSQEKKTFEKALELFKREAEHLRDLGTHPQIPELLAFLEQDRKMYLIQEYIDGQDIYRELKIKQTFTESEVKQFLQNLLPVLEFIHSHQVIHRDIKPENIIRRRKDSALVLIDFGVSKQIDDSLETVAGTVTGTIGYWAPEQLRGVSYFNTDIYALGVTAIRLLTGCLPHGSGKDELYSIDDMEWVWHERVNISQHLKNILDKMLVANPKKRFQTGGEVLQALQSSPTEAVSSPSFVEAASKDEYTQLKDLLIAQKYRQADEETYRLVLKFAKRQTHEFLLREHLIQLPCDVLRTIDLLWLQHSNQTFGFTVQREIWQNFFKAQKDEQQIWEAFALEVGWHNPKGSIDYSKLKFNLWAPLGQFPARIYWLDHLKTWMPFPLGPKLLECHI